ncbi:MAG: hypothetical protein AMJ42_01920 [Deltaproteobacteria bacterium DG_8]|nr:MAG: hypothetical protein AMJ42_01920 [Deltaproteobacteria bacterium DG_8]
MEELKKSIRYQRKKSPEPPQQFEEFEASSLFCPKCKEAVPVRKKLLLVLPEGDKYDYLCSKCGNSIGSKITKEDIPIQFITK